MTPMQLPAGFWWILLVGLAVILVATLVDWRRDTVRARRTDEQLAQHDPGTQRVEPSVLSAAEAARLATQVTSLAAHLPTDRFSTHVRPSRSITRGTLVLVSDDPLGDLRTILTPLQRASAQGAPLALVAPGFSDDLLEVLATNLQAGHLVCVPLVADDQARTSIAELTGARPVELADLQSGHLPDDRYGRAELLVADTESAAVVRPDSAPANTRMPTA